jgi:hypothetical protein
MTSETMKINDNVKSHRTSQLLLSGGLFISNTVLFFSKLEEDNNLKYIMLSLAIIFLLFFVFYWIKVSHQEHIKS